MKKKTIGSLSGFGIGALVVMAIIMIVQFYNKFPDQPFYIRIFEGAWRFFASIIGSGAIILIFYIGFYVAIHLADMVFIQDEEHKENLLNYVTKLANPIVIIGFLIAYVILFLDL